MSVRDESQDHGNAMDGAPERCIKEAACARARVCVCMFVCLCVSTYLNSGPNLRKSGMELSSSR